MSKLGFNNHISALKYPLINFKSEIKQKAY